MDHRGDGQRARQRRQDGRDDRAGLFAKLLHGRPSARERRGVGEVAGRYRQEVGCREDRIGPALQDRASGRRRHDRRRRPRRGRGELRGQEPQGQGLRLVVRAQRTGRVPAQPRHQGLDRRHEARRQGR